MTVITRSIRVSPHPTKSRRSAICSVVRMPVCSESCSNDGGVGLSADPLHRRGQIAFTETLGTLATERRGEQVYNVTLDNTVNKQADYLKGSLYWHLDGTMNEVPIFASLLSSKVLPRDGGGDTEFCNTYAAYEDLSDEDKQPLGSLRAMHSTWNTLLYYDPEPDITTLRQMMALGERELPLVWTHRSGRKSLILGCTAGRILGMDIMASTETLVRLRNWRLGRNSFTATSGLSAIW